MTCFSSHCKTCSIVIGLLKATYLLTYLYVIIIAVFTVLLVCSYLPCCMYTCVWWTTATPAPPCGDRFHCGSGECIDYEVVCNGNSDCADASDEPPHCRKSWYFIHYIDTYHIRHSICHGALVVTGHVCVCKQVRDLYWVKVSEENPGTLWWLLRQQDRLSECNAF